MLTSLTSAYEGLGVRARARMHFLFYVVVLVVMTLVTYHSYVLGVRYLVYVGVGSDSFSQYVPFFINEADNLATFDFSPWNFSQFLGAATPDEIAPEYLASLLGRNFVPQMMLVSQMAKIIFAGIFLYLYLGYFKLSYKTRLSVGLGYAFCGRMTALCAWGGYVMEATLLAAMLWGFERFYSDRRKVVVLPAAFALTILNRGVYGLVLYSFVMLAYAIFRVGFTEGQPLGRSAIALLFLQLAGLWAAGVALSAPVLIPTLELYGQSARVTATISNDGMTGLSLLSGPSVLAESVTKFYSTCLFGTLNSYSGYGNNILEAPYFYCGALALLGLPFSFCQRSRRQRVWLGILLACSAAYLLLPAVRMLLSGFSTDENDFRMSSFWIEAVLALMGALGLEELWRHGHGKGLALWAAILLTVLSVCCLYLREGLHLRYALFSAALIVAYALLITIAHRTGRYALLVMAVALVPFELVAQNYYMVNRTSDVTPEQYEQTYSDVLRDDLARLSSSDIGPYRVSYPSILLTRAMGYGYYGTQAYIGGVGITRQQTEFLGAMGSDYIEALGYSRYAYGFNSDSLNELLGVRFLVYGASDSNYAPVGYRQVSGQESYFQIYENRYPLPFFYGYSYDESISTDQFYGVAREYRDEQMLSTVVVDGGERHDGEVSPWTDDSDLVASWDRSITKDAPATVRIPQDAGSRLLIDADLSGTTTESGDVEFTVTLDDDDPETPAKTILYLTASGNERVQIPVENDGYTSAAMEIIATNLCDDAELSNARITTQPSWMADYVKDQYDRRMAFHPTVTRYSGSEIEGTIDMREGGYLVTSIPWSTNWHVYVDGVDTQTTVVNLGFVGAQVSGGSHTVRLAYEDMGQTVGVAMSVGCVSMLAVARLTAWLRVRRRAKSL